MSNEQSIQTAWNHLIEQFSQPYKSADHLIDPDFVFFYRLSCLIKVQSSWTADLAAAYRDALCCAVVHQLLPAELPIVGQPRLTTLQACGLIQHGQGIRLNHTVLYPDVYQQQQRRFLDRPVLDPLLIQRVGDQMSVQHYQGVGQQQAVRQLLLSQTDTKLLIQLPTGTGKTLMIHALAQSIAPQQLIIVVVPTIGLMLEQVQRAREVLRETTCDTWHAGVSEFERQQIRTRIEQGQQKLLFCAPESLLGSFRNLLFRVVSAGRLAALFVDEAHLIDQWGGDFRPDFQLLAPLYHALREQYPQQPFRLVLMSATFSQTTRDLLRESFCWQQGGWIEVDGSFLRPEPQYHVIRCTPDEHQQQIERVIYQLPRPLIIYASTRQDVIDWKKRLQHMGFQRIGCFHGETQTEERQALIDAWRQDQLDIMVATSAFGVGMDKKDVRSVLHIAIPETLDRFYQEAGRAGRDGRACIAMLIYTSEQFKMAENIAKQKLLTIEKGLERWKALLRDMTAVGQARYQFNLNVFRRALARGSEHNVDWNIKLLLLLQRAGWLRIYVQPHPKLQESTEDQHVIHVELLEPHHSDERLWQTQIESQRIQEQQRQQQGLQHIKNWLREVETQPLCRVLQRFYSTTDHVTEYACGGCPACQRTFTPTLAKTVSVYVRHPVVRHVPASWQAIYYDLPSNQPPTMDYVLRSWQTWLDVLLKTGKIQAIRARPEVLKRLANLTKSARYPFWYGLSPTDASGDDVELVLLMPDDHTLPPWSWDQRQIVIAPSTLKDPDYPYRTWYDINTNSQNLSAFIREVVHVDSQ